MDMDAANSTEEKGPIFIKAEQEVSSDTASEPTDPDSSSAKLDVDTEVKQGTKTKLLDRKDCNVCNRKRYTSEELKIHELHHKNKGFTCPICNTTLAVSRDKKRHMKLHTGTDLHPCYLCDKVFIQKTDLEKHNRQHTGEKPFICEVCSKGFTRLNVLRRHKLIHTGERPYKCKCGKSFTRPYFLREHIKKEKH